MSTDARHGVEPLCYTGAMAAAKEKLLVLIQAMPRSRLRAMRAGYLHAEFTTLIFRFVDDMEFVFDDEAKQIHVRSASRQGYWDMGVNRRRVEEFRRRFEGGCG